MLDREWRKRTDDLAPSPFQLFTSLSQLNCRDSLQGLRDDEISNRMTR